MIIIIRLASHLLEAPEQVHLSVGSGTHVWEKLRSYKLRLHTDSKQRRSLQGDRTRHSTRPRLGCYTSYSETGMSSGQITGQDIAILTEIVRDFPQPLQANTRAYLLTDHDASSHIILVHYS
jgi:hypothetical protein